MPNGGPDNCSECPQNRAVAVVDGRAMRSGSGDFCDLRDLDLGDDPVHVYCANQPRNNCFNARLPLGRHQVAVEYDAHDGYTREWAGPVPDSPEIRSMLVSLMLELTRRIGERDCWLSTVSVNALVDHYRLLHAEAAVPPLRELVRLEPYIWQTDQVGFAYQPAALPALLALGDILAAEVEQDVVACLQRLQEARTWLDALWADDVDDERYDDFSEASGRLDNARAQALDALFIFACSGRDEVLRTFHAEDWNPYPHTPLPVGMFASIEVTVAADTGLCARWTPGPADHFSFVPHALYEQRGTVMSRQDLTQMQASGNLTPFGPFWSPLVDLVGYRVAADVPARDGTIIAKVNAILTLEHLELIRCSAPTPLEIWASSLWTRRGGRCRGRWELFPEAAAGLSEDRARYEPAGVEMRRSAAVDILSEQAAGPTRCRWRLAALRDAVEEWDLAVSWLEEATVRSAQDIVETALEQGFSEDVAVWSRAVQPLRLLVLAVERRHRGAAVAALAALRRITTEWRGGSGLDT